MKRDIAIVGAGIVAVAAALAVGPAPTQPRPMAAPAGQLQSLTDILERVRQDVGFYEVQAARWRGDMPDAATPDPALTVAAHDDPPDIAHPQGQHWTERSIANVCPIDQYDFDVVRIELTLQVVSVNTVTGHAGLKVPFLGADADAGISASRGRSMTKTIVLDRAMHYDPVELSAYYHSTDYATLRRGNKADEAAATEAARAGGGAAPAAKVFPVSDTLLALRQTLVEAAEKWPCFDIEPGGINNDSIKLDFQVQMSADPNVGFTFLVYSAGADDKIQKSSENTMVVTFAPHAKHAT